MSKPPVPTPHDKMADAGIDARPDTRPDTLANERADARLALRLRAFGRVVAGLVYTPLCPMCQSAINAATPHTLCAACWQGLPFMPRHHCTICSQPLPDQSAILSTAPAAARAPTTICFTCQQRPIAVDGIVAPFLYRAPFNKLILQLKYADDLSLSKFFVHHLHAALLTMTRDDNLANYMLLPVPSHFSRTIKRKYNQAEVLATALSRLSAMPMVGNLLQRIEPTSQKNIGADARFRQLKNAFSLNKKIWARHRDKKIILVDDVVTTCATMHHLAILLKKNGASFVGGVAIARTPLQ